MANAAAQDPANHPNYNALANRAYAYLQSAGGTAGGDDLAREVFGPTAKGVLWGQMLARVLGADPRFRAAPGGRWSLAGLGVTSLPLDAVDFVVLDLERTGLKPSRQRVVDIAALRLVEGRVGDAFATLVNPGRRLPKYLCELAGFSQEDAATAPVFAEVAADLLSFLEGAVLVGHGLSLDIGFLQHELRLLGRPPLANPVLDTLDLAGRLLPGRGKPTLDNLAALLGLPVGRRHRAANDARLVAAVFGHLLSLAKSEGATDLAAILPPATATPARYALLDPSPLREVPGGPGVYLLKDASGKVVYAGKAVNLRARLGTYFSRPPAYERRMEGLLEAVADFEAIPLGSELAALLAEARLIADHRPRFNVQQRAKAQPAYLRLDPCEQYPRLAACGEPSGDGARYWGPLRNGTAVRAALRQLNDLFPLRTCRRRLAPKRGRKTKALPACRALGQCLGPCAGLFVDEEYCALVTEAVAFLDGDLARTLRRLQGKLAEAVAAGDRPQVARWQKLLRAARLFALDGREAGRPAPGANLAVVLPSGDPGLVEVFVLSGGRFGGQRKVDPLDGEAGAMAGTLREMALRAAAGDEANIVVRWLAANPSAPTVALPAGEDGWAEAAAVVQRLGDAVLSGAVGAPETPPEEV